MFGGCFTPPPAGRDQEQEWSKGYFCARPPYGCGMFRVVPCDLISDHTKNLAGVYQTSLFCDHPWPSIIIRAEVRQALSALKGYRKT